MRNNMSEPLVSIIVPTKNSSATLTDCLSSIANQSYSNIELIVVDNFSDDTTPNIAKKFTKNFFSKGPERSAQRNFAVSKASGKYICLIDSDMNLDESVVAECVELMEGNTNIAGVIIPEESFGEGFWANCKHLERSFYIGVPYMEAARFFKRIDFNKVKGYNFAMVSGEDWDLSQRMEVFGRLARTPSFIHHNEGKISLFKTVKKKYYYATRFASYTSNSKSRDKVTQQVSILGRYRLFFSKPKQLFANPLLGLGMLFMKTCEFGFGAAGYIVARMRKTL